MICLHLLLSKKSELHGYTLNPLEINQSVGSTTVYLSHICLSEIALVAHSECRLRSPSANVWFESNEDTFCLVPFSKWWEAKGQKCSKLGRWNTGSQRGFFFLLVPHPFPSRKHGEVLLQGTAILLKAVLHGWEVSRDGGKGLVWNPTGWVV